MEILKIENLSKIYKTNENEVKALDNISFSVERGEFIAIIGASGSGKSTLLHTISGLDNPTSGNIYIEGVDISELDKEKMALYRRRQIGLVYQFYNLVPILTAKENIQLPILLDNGKVISEEWDELIKILGLQEQLNKFPNQLSGGQQQRVALGRALITKPSIILADEPTGNLDTKNSKEIMSYLKYCNKKYSQTILMVTHNEEIALQTDRIIKIEDGKIIFDRKIN